MGLSNFPSAAEGVLPLLVMNTVLSVALLKNMVRSVMHVMGANIHSQDYDETPDGCPEEIARNRRISISQYKSMCQNISAGVGKTECCVCLCGFVAEEEVSELSCKHFFHRGCLEKWFHNNNRTTCPLCRSID